VQPESVYEHCEIYNDIRAARLSALYEKEESNAHIPYLAERFEALDRFPSDRHPASWAGMCPGNHESAGKRSSGKTAHGNTYLRAVLCELAWVIAHTTGTYLPAFYHRVARHRGKKRAILAVAHTLLVITYHVLKTKKPYNEPGEDYFDQLERVHIECRSIRQLEQ
jgi:transposase